MSTVVEVPAEIAFLPAITGDPEAVASFGATFLRVSSTLDDLDTTASTNRAPEGWSGEAAEAYCARVDDVAVDSGTASLALRKIASAVEGYGEEVARLRTERDRLVSERHNYVLARNDLLADIAVAEISEKDALDARAATLTSHPDVLVRDIETLYKDEAENDSSLRSYLSRFSSMWKARQSTAGGDVADDLLDVYGAPGTGATPEQTKLWWDGLSDAEKDAVTAAAPELIGSADGLPASARDRANRILLENDLKEIEVAERDGTLSVEQEEVATNARAARDGLIEAGRTIDPITGEPVEAFLHLYDPRAFGGDGKIAVAVGNPDTAENVSAYVPGVTSAGDSAEGNAEAAGNIYQSARYSGAGSTAVIAWIGYDAPSGADTAAAAKEGAATEGGELLANYVNGLVVAREGENVHFTVIGHSYGSTTVGHAATDWGLPVDDIVLLGSPGAGEGAATADDLRGPEGRYDPVVWAGTASRDPVGRLGDEGELGMGWILEGLAGPAVTAVEAMEKAGGVGLGRNPVEDDFGAIRIQAEHPDRIDLISEDREYSFEDHVRYLEPGSEGLYATGLIVAGLDGEVPRAAHVYDPWLGSPVDPEFDRRPGTMPSRIPYED